MALLSVIRRWHFREHLSIREICRRTGLSRNTIRKYLRLNGLRGGNPYPVTASQSGDGRTGSQIDSLSAQNRTLSRLS